MAAKTAWRARWRQRCVRARARACVRGRGRETNPQNVAVGGETALALEELGHGVDRRKQVAVRARARACDGRQSRHRGA